MFLGIWQNSQENTCDRVSFLVKLKTEAFFIKHIRATVSDLLRILLWGLCFQSSTTKSSLITSKVPLSTVSLAFYLKFYPQHQAQYKLFYYETSNKLNRFPSNKLVDCLANINFYNFFLDARESNVNYYEW